MGGALAGAIGRPRKVVLQSFVIYEDEVRVVSRLEAFRRICTVLTVHLPALRDGDQITFDAPAQFLSGKATVLEHKHIRTSGEMKTALAIRLNDQEANNG